MKAERLSNLAAVLVAADLSRGGSEPARYFTDGVFDAEQAVDDAEALWLAAQDMVQLRERSAPVVETVAKSEDLL